MNLDTTIKTFEGFIQFRFTPFHTGGGIKIFIRTTGLVSDFHFFIMQIHKGVWTLMNIEKVPSWIVAIERELSNVIIESCLLKDK